MDPFFENEFHPRPVEDEILGETTRSSDSVKFELFRLAKEEENLSKKQDELKEALGPLDIEEELLMIKLEKVRKEKRRIKEQNVLNARRLRVIKEEADRLKRLKAKVVSEEKAKKQYYATIERIEEIIQRATWKDVAFKHQIEGAKHIALADGRAVLADKRGLGKTLTSIIAADLLGAKKIVYLAAAETIRNVDKEISEKWAQHRNVITMISEPKSDRNFILTRALPKFSEFILTINLEAWRMDKSILWKIIDLQPDMIIIDEAHSLKTFSSATTEGVRTIASAVNMCGACGHNKLDYRPRTLTNPDSLWHCLHPNCEATWAVGAPELKSVKYVLPMTGTPILNRPLELFALLHLVDPERFPDEKAFRQDYLKPEEYVTLTGSTGTRWVFKGGKTELLLNSIGPQFLQRDMKSAGVVLPPQGEIRYTLEMGDAQRAAYELMMKHLAISISESQGVNAAMEPITKILRCRQITSHPPGIQIKDRFGEVIYTCNVQESVKMDKTIELLQELVSEGERVVVFSKYNAFLVELNKRLKELDVDGDGNAVRVRPALLIGDTPTEVRGEIRDDFDMSVNKTGSYKYDCVLAQYAVGGVSLTLTGAHHMIMVDREWNPGKDDQARGRIDRIGQTRNTTVHLLECEDTIDEDIASLLDDKASIVEGFETEAAFAQAVLRRIRGENG